MLMNSKVAVHVMSLHRLTQALIKIRIIWRKCVWGVSKQSRNSQDNLIEGEYLRGDIRSSQNVLQQLKQMILAKELQTNGREWSLEIDAYLCLFDLGT